MHPVRDVQDPRFGYSSWHCQTSGASMDSNPASDGETFFTTALLFAAQVCVAAGRGYRGGLGGMRCIDLVLVRGVACDTCGACSAGAMRGRGTTPPRRRLCSGRCWARKRRPVALAAARASSTCLGDTLTRTQRSSCSCPTPRVSAREQLVIMKFTPRGGGLACATRPFAALSVRRSSPRSCELH